MKKADVNVDMLIEKLVEGAAVKLTEVGRTFLMKFPDDL